MEVDVRVGRDGWTTAQRTVVALSAGVGILARWWALGGPRLSFDESFTAAYAGLPIGQIPGALRAHDSHPPLDYLLRHPLAGLHSELWLRAPSAVFSTLAVVLVVVWMRRRSWYGVGVVALFALGPFEVLYGREARMYSLMVLVGVAVAMLAERWWRDGLSAAPLVAVGALVAVACLDHAGGVFLAAGAVTLPGLRRDRDAWRWRLAIAGGVVVWALVWGLSFVDQAGVGSSSWVPLTSPRAMADTVGGLATFIDGAGWVVGLLVIAGGACTRVLDRALGRLWLSLFVVPFGLLAVAGLHYHVLLPRTLASAAWGIPVALAALVSWSWSRWNLVGAVVGLMVAALTLRSLPQAVSYDEGFGAPVTAAIARVEPGDGLLVHPSWWWPLARWNGAEPGADAVAPPASVASVDGWYWLRPGAEPTGRTWLLEPTSYHLDTSAWPSCGPVEPIGGDWELGCLVTGGS